MAPVPVSFNPDSPWEEYDGALVTTDATSSSVSGNSGLRLLFRSTIISLRQRHLPKWRTFVLDPSE